MDQGPSLVQTLRIGQTLYATRQVHTPVGGRQSARHRLLWVAVPGRVCRRLWHGLQRVVSLSPVRGTSVTHSPAPLPSHHHPHTTRHDTPRTKVMFISPLLRPRLNTPRSH